MARCPTCGQTINAATRGADVGGQRGGRLLPEEAANWVPVARLTNLAEAGFAESFLAEAGIPSCLRQVDDFSAVDGSWSQVYVLQVPEQQAEQAAERLGEELLESASQATAAADLVPPPKVRPAWPPLALLLLAVGLLYVSLSGQLIPPRRSTRPSLGDVLRRLNQPLKNAPLVGPPHYQIRFDPARQAIVIDADRNGDRISDQQWEFYRNRHGNWLER